MGRFSVDARALYAAVRRGLMISLAAAVLGVLFNAVSPRGIGLLGPVPHRDKLGIKEVGLKQAWTLYEKRKGVFVDARSAEEFGAGHIPGALLLPEDDFDQAVSSWKRLIPPDTLLITYCSGGGCNSSRDVAQLLREAGYSRVEVFYGGWEEWKSAGYPVEKGAQTMSNSTEELEVHSDRQGLRTGGG